MADLDGICMTKRRGHLVPSDIHADEWVAKLGEGKEVMVMAHRARNTAHHRKFFALLRLVRENDPQSRWMDEQALLDDLKKRIGYGEWRVDGFSGLIIWYGRSISFASMSQDRFEAFYDRACELLATEILRVAPQTLTDQVMEFMGERKAA